MVFSLRIQDAIEVQICFSYGLCTPSWLPSGLIGVIPTHSHPSSLSWIFGTIAFIEMRRSGPRSYA